jgi:hypothetical protein
MGKEGSEAAKRFTAKVYVNSAFESILAVIL